MKRHNTGVLKNRFNNPSQRGIMSGILLSPGPVSTKVTVQGVSRVFNNAVNIAKFESAATKLQELGYGRLISLDQFNQKKNMVFIKPTPDQMCGLLQGKDTADLSTAEEYAMRFTLPVPSTVSMKLQNRLVAEGFVPQHYFVQKDA